MLKKILKIKRVGLFNDAKFTSGIFNKATLIYAENGRGKSTLASIFRSCAANDTESVSLRQTLGNNAAQEIQFLFENGTSPTQTTFNGSIWSNPCSDILVFDTEFVDKNVYSGSVVGTNHRQELLEFALGEDAVQLKQKVDSEAQKASESTREISAIEKLLASHRNGMPLEAFSGLESDLDVDQKIESLNIRLAAAKNNAALQGKSCPELLVEPSLDLDSFFVILFKTLDDIEKDAEETVHTHISKNPNENFEAWLSEGQLFENLDDCPYCGQNILGTALLVAYKAHFNQEYVDLKTKVARLSQDIEKQLSDTVINQLFSTVERNQIMADGWNEHIPLQKFEFDRDTLLHIFEQIRNLLRRLTQAKQQNPLELIGSVNDKNQVEELWEQVLVAVRTCNESIDSTTEKIMLFKSNLAKESIQNLQQEIKRLNLVQIRQGQTVCDLIQQWNALKTTKQMHEQEKANARTALDTLMNQTLQQYQSKINDLVRKFGVLFEIDSLRPDYVGSTGLPRSNYGLKVKGQAVKLSADDAPSFSNALSEGDKRTLAFAFFIARIESDLNLNSKIIVVDDPVCSLDRNRRTQTKRILRDIGMKSKQLIVLGHDSHFLRDLRDDLQDNNVDIPTQLLKINRIADNYSDFSPFDIYVECASDYYRNHKSLQDFVDGQQVQDIRTVARAIRPLLEGYLHRRFPGHVKRSKLFGQIVGDAKVAQPPNPLVYLQPLVTELHEINDYAGKFHHDTNGAADTAYIEESELRSYAERALTVIHKGAF